MTAPAGIPRVRISFRSAAIVIGTLALAIFSLRVLRSAERVVGWIAFAGAVAFVVDPLVSALQRWVPRGLAIVAVMLVLLGGVGVAVYGAVDDVTTQTRRLEEILPREARKLERGSRFRDQLQQIEFTRRTRAAVRSLPRVIQGGSAEEAVRSAADRGAAVLASLILTLFFLAYGRRGLATVIDQIPDPERRPWWRAAAVETYHRASRYALGTMLLAVITGIVAFVLGRLVGIPGPAALAVWAGLWSLVPLFGPLVGSIPIITLTATTRDPADAVVVTLVLLAFHVAKDVYARRRIERTTVRVGPFLTAFAAVIGLELYGLGGALVWMLGVTILLAAADVLGAERHEALEHEHAS